MTKKEKLISILPYLVLILFFVSYVAIIVPAYSEWINQFFDFDDTRFMIINVSSMILTMIFMYIILTIFVIIHELGHLVFGINAGLKFDSFCFLWFVIQKQENKIKLIMKPMISGVGGYCSLRIENAKHRDLNKIKLFYMGGVIFNFISAFVFFVFSLFTQNIYIDTILWGCIITNLYLALNNILPTTVSSGLEIDMLHVNYCNSDPHYMNTLYIHQCATDLLNEEKTFDSLQLKMPSSFNTISDILLSNLYVENLIFHSQYEEAMLHITNVLTNATHLLNKRHIQLFKIQKINCLLNMAASSEELKKVWDKDLEQFITTMSAFSPSLIAYNYLNATIIENNEKKAQKYKHQFAKVNKNNYPKYEIKDAENLFKKIEEYLSKKQ